MTTLRVIACVLMTNTEVKTTTNSIGVDSVDAAVKTVQGAGGKLNHAETPIPTVGYFAYLEDTEGNLVAVMQANPRQIRRRSPRRER